MVQNYIGGLKMAVLEQEFYDKVIEMGRKAVVEYKNNNFDIWEDYAEKGWELFPEPKYNWNQAYNYAKMAFKNNFKQKRFEQAKKWLDRMIEDNNINHSYDGEIEFIIGMYNFETGTLEDAYKMFVEAVKQSGKSHYRYFENEDAKYLEFYKKQKKSEGKK
jgi:tetratricopeptide (TPR) repeat protein